jgi:hypothetical protein
MVQYTLKHFHIICDQYYCAADFSLWDAYIFSFIHVAL